jgi:hypothetical protein
MTYEVYKPMIIAKWWSQVNNSPASEPIDPILAGTSWSGLIN